MSDSISPADPSNQQLAERTAKRITQEIVERLQKFPSVRTNSGDPAIENMWEEICVQRQDEEFGDWENYLDIIKGQLEGIVEVLQRNEAEALWLQTPSGMNWEDEEESERGPLALYNQEIVEYLLNSYVLPEAEEWTNPNVANYLARGIKEDDEENLDEEEADNKKV